MGILFSMWSQPLSPVSPQFLLLASCAHPRWGARNVHDNNNNNNNDSNNNNQYHYYNTYNKGPEIPNSRSCAGRDEGSISDCTIYFIDSKLGLGHGTVACLTTINPTTVLLSVSTISQFQRSFNEAGFLTTYAVDRCTLLSDHRKTIRIPVTRRETLFYSSLS